MVKKLHFLLLGLLISFGATAQLSTITTDSLVIDEEDLTTSFDVKGYLINTGTDTLNATWDVTNTAAIATDWEFSNSFCFTPLFGAGIGGACIDLAFASTGAGAQDMAPGDSVELKLQVGANNYSDTVVMDLNILVEVKGSPMNNQSHVVTMIAAFKADSTVSIQFVNKNALEIYPNPTSNVLNFNVEDLDAQKIEFYNVIGSLVKSVDYTKSVDVSELDNGFYLVKVYDAKSDAYFTQTFIKN